MLPNSLIPAGGEPGKVIVQWRLYEDSAYAINISKYIGASHIMIGFIYPPSKPPAHVIKPYVELYRNNGFSVYLWTIIKNVPLPESGAFADYFELDIEGIGIDLDPTVSAIKSEKEAWLIKIADAAQLKGKKLAYYHGDGLSDVNSLTLVQHGLIVWAQWTALQWWLPKSWDLPQIYAQCAVWNMSPEQPGKYTTPDYIRNWNASMPGKPAGIVWFLSTANHKPTEEQIQTMKETSSYFLQA